MLNWRRDPGYEQRMNNNRIAIERSKERTKLIEKEIEQLDHENAKEEALSDSIRRLCFPPESSSIPQTSIKPDSEPSLPS
jgi:hypothetical protein